MLRLERGATEHLPKLLHGILSSPSSKLPEESWRDFLRTIFEPLELIALPHVVEETRVCDEGLTMDVSCPEGNGVRLRSARLGKRLFSKLDEDFVHDIVAVIRKTLLLKTSLEEARQHERRCIAGELHDHLGASLLTILRDDDQRVQEVARTLTRELRAVITSLGPRFLALSTLLTGWRAKVENQCRACGIALVWQEPVEHVEVLLSTSDARNLCGILQESVTNALRHSELRNLTVRIAQSDLELELIVEDDGKGLEPHAPRSGFGMRNLEFRASEMGGTISWETVQPHGCRVKARLPMRPAGS